MKRIYRTLLFIHLLCAVFFSTTHAQIADQPEEEDRFGAFLTTGDFNGDKADDLVVSVRDEGIGANTRAGAVHVIYGTPGSGLSDIGSQFLHQDVMGLDSETDKDEFFGWSPTSGDYNGDGFDDLIIGVPYETFGDTFREIGFHVLYGSTNGLETAGSKFFKIRIEEPAFALFNYAGLTMTTGNFNGDKFDDLAAGLHIDDVDDVDRAGSVHVFYGTEAGLPESDADVWTQNRLELSNSARTDDFFGDQLAAGDFNGDQIDDLAVSAIQDEYDSDLSFNSGIVNIIYGSNDGLTKRGAQELSQFSILGLRNADEKGDRFGFALTAGDFNNDKMDDLAFGIPFKSHLPDRIDDGVVHVLYGTDDGISTANSEIWDQEVPGVDGEAETSDWFGYALTAADFNGNGFIDLVIGVRGERVSGIGSAGNIHVLTGSEKGLDVVGGSTWHQETAGINGNAELSDHFGEILATGDFDGDNVQDLAIGVPSDKSNDVSNAGAVYILYGSFDKGLSTNKHQRLYQGVQLPVPVSISDEAIPTQAFQFDLYPNPFVNEATMTFDLAAPSNVELALFDLLGRKVQTITNRVYAAGRHTVQIEVMNLPAGTYLARLSTKDATHTRYLVRLP